MLYVKEPCFLATLAHALVNHLSHTVDHVTWYIFRKNAFSKLYFPKCIFAECTWLKHILIFARLYALWHVGTWKLNLMCKEFGRMPLANRNCEKVPNYETSSEPWANLAQKAFRYWYGKLFSLSVKNLMASQYRKLLNFLLAYFRM